MTSPFVCRRRVEFRDTDAAGIMHFSAFFDFMEMAEHAFWRHLGLSVLMADAEGALSWPRVSARCDFRSPARFEDELEIEVRVVRLGTSSLTLGYRILLTDRLVAEGEITAVCCRLGGPAPVTVPIPDWIRSRLAAAGPPEHAAP